MKKMFLKRIGINILVGSLIVTPVATSLCTPMTVYAEEVVITGDCPENVANGVNTDSNATVGTNKGGINSNLGTVTYNEGTIKSNNGTVDTNNASGTIEANNRTVNTNNGTIDYNVNNGGTVDTNNGTVKDNDGTVTTNESSGKIDTNDGDGKVSTNKGTVTTNIGTVTTNESGGTVVTNEGTVKTNDGTVTTNTKNKKVEINNGTVDTNLGTVESNTGTIKENFGTVTNNTGTVTDNYGDAYVGGGTVSNQWVLISTNLDAVKFNIETDMESYVGETIRKRQIEGLGTDTILDDKEAIYIRSGKAGYLFAGSSVTEIIVPDETDATTKGFMDAGNLTYDSATEKTRVVLEHIESKVINLVFKIINRNSIPEEEPVVPEGPVTPVTPVVPKETDKKQETKKETKEEAKVVEAQAVNISQLVTPQLVAAPAQNLVTVGNTALVATVPGITQTVTVPAATILNLNESLPKNAVAPTVVKSVNVQTNGGATAGTKTATATVNVTTLNGNVNISPQLVSGLKSAVTSQFGANASKSVDIKVNTKAADGKDFSIVVNTDALKNNATLKVYIVDPETGGYVLTDMPSVKYNDKTGITTGSLAGGNTYQIVSEKEAKAIEQTILNSVKVSAAFSNPVAAKAGGKVDMSKALSDGLNMTNVSEVEYKVSGSKATIDSKTGQLVINGNATKGTITVSIKVTLKNGKTKTIKAKVKVG